MIKKFTIYHNAENSRRKIEDCHGIGHAAKALRMSNQSVKIWYNNGRREWLTRNHAGDVGPAEDPDLDPREVWAFDHGKGSWAISRKYPGCNTRERVKVVKSGTSHTLPVGKGSSFSEVLRELRKLGEEHFGEFGWAFFHFSNGETLEVLPGDSCKAKSRLRLFRGKDETYGNVYRYLDFVPSRSAQKQEKIYGMV